MLHCKAMLKEWWLKLTMREQRVLSVGVAFGGVFLGYLLVYAPLVTRVSMLRQNIEAQQKLLVWMRVMDKKIQQMRGPGVLDHSMNSPIEMLSYLKKQITQAGMLGQMAELKQGANDTIVLRFQHVDFDRLAALLALMVKEQRVHVLHGSAQAEGMPGVVSAEITFGSLLKR